jgi:hypothetical protein
MGRFSGESGFETYLAARRFCALYLFSNDLEWNSENVENFMKKAETDDAFFEKWRSEAIKFREENCQLVKAENNKIIKIPR